MKSKIKKSTAIALGAAAAAVGVASHANAQNITVSGSETPAITYVLALNDDGWGDYTPNSFAVYAVDGQVTLAAGSPGSGNQMVASGVVEGNDGGILGYGVAISNALTLNDDIQNGSAVSGHTKLGKNGQLEVNTYYNILPTISTASSDLVPVSAGFTTGNQDTATSVGGEQVQIGTAPPSSAAFKPTNGQPAVGTTTIPIFGLGQSGASMGGDFINSAPAVSGYTFGNQPGTVGGLAPKSGKYVFSGPVLASNASFVQGLYLTGLLVAEGTYSPSNVPVLSDTSGTNIYLQNVLYAAANEAYVDGGYTPSAATPAFFGETLGVPEPASVGLIGVGAMGLLARRRRRELRKT